ncbi:nuclear transport factor 2 family protein [Spongiibacter sp.]|uniref:nuclear transport factor 2 family protein n=1 Tax=Spongiibacter sp. TaxID=2024860 RepID=UPI0035664EB6
MDNIDALAQRLQQLEDIAAITALKYRYLNACDAKQPEQVLACFAAGPINIDFGHIGRFDSREAFVEVFTELGCHPHIVDLHHAQNPLIHIDGPNLASGNIGLHFQSINTRDKTRLQMGGHYRDQYQRIDNQWRITASCFNVTAVEMTDFSGGQSVVTYVGNCMPQR